MYHWQDTAAPYYSRTTVKDKKGQRVRVSAPNELPDGFEAAKVITLFGHLHQKTFEAVSVSIP